MQDYRESIRSANRSNEAAYHDSRPFTLPLFTRVRGIGILGSSHTGSCINRPPAAAERASKGLHTACQGPHLVVVHEDTAGRILHGPQMIPVFSYVRHARGMVRFLHKKRTAWDRGEAKGRSAMPRPWWMRASASRP